MTFYLRIWYFISAQKIVFAENYLCDSRGRFQLPTQDSKKKNVIVLLIDSLTSNCIGKGRTEESSTPFLDTLLPNSIYAPNVYSFGPYTDAATKGLWCSMPTLMDYGYYFSINGSDINPYKIFKENGYETYGFYYPYYMMSPKTVQHIDHTMYTSGYAFYANWRNFGYYSDIMKKRDLSDEEVFLMTKSLDLIFSGWLQYYTMLQKDEKASRIIIDIAPPNLSEAVNNAYKKLLSEYDKFKMDRTSYLFEFLEAGMNHALASIDPFDIDLHINRKFLKEIIYKENRSFFRDAHRSNVIHNLKNNRLSVKKIIKGISDFIRTHDPYELKYPANYYLGLNSIRTVVKGSLKKNWQYQPSARRQIEAGMDSISKRNNEKPFYAIFHVEEPHAPVAFFSYDLNEKSIIHDELEYIKPLINKCGKDFKGNLGYQMAVRYDDYCLKIIFDKMKQIGIENNTVVMITADHGSSYLYSPVRKRTVNCFHKENYNIPLIIWDKDLKQQQTNTNKFTSADIYTTLYDYLQLQVNEKLHGISMLKNPSGRDVVITEYMGPGCPDMISRDAWMSARNDQWMISYKINMGGEFDPGKPHQIFDLLKDPDEIENLARKIDLNEPELKILSEAVAKRFTEIKKDRDSFLEKLKAGVVSL